jgi:hypothetical protein
VLDRGFNILTGVYRKLNYYKALISIAVNKRNIEHGGDIVSFEAADGKTYRIGETVFNLSKFGSP